MKAVLQDGVSGVRRREGSEQELLAASVRKMLAAAVRRRWELCSNDSKSMGSSSEGDGSDAMGSSPEGGGPSQTPEWEALEKSFHEQWVEEQGFGPTRQFARKSCRNLGFTLRPIQACKDSGRAAVAEDSPGEEELGEDIMDAEAEERSMVSGGPGEVMKEDRTDRSALGVVSSDGLGEPGEVVTCMQQPGEAVVWFPGDPIVRGILYNMHGRGWCTLLSPMTSAEESGEDGSGQESRWSPKSAGERTTILEAGQGNAGASSHAADSQAGGGEEDCSDQEEQPGAARAGAEPSRGGIASAVWKALRRLVLSSARNRQVRYAAVEVALEAAFGQLMVSESGGHAGQHRGPSTQDSQQTAAPAEPHELWQTAGLGAIAGLYAAGRATGGITGAIRRALGGLNLAADAGAPLADPLVAVVEAIESAMERILNDRDQSEEQGNVPLAAGAAQAGGGAGGTDPSRGNGVRKEGTK